MGSHSSSYLLVQEACLFQSFLPHSLCNDLYFTIPDDISLVYSTLYFSPSIRSCSHNSLLQTRKKKTVLYCRGLGKDTSIMISLSLFFPFFFFPFIIPFLLFTIPFYSISLFLIVSITKQDGGILISMIQCTSFFSGARKSPLLTTPSPSYPNVMTTHHSYSSSSALPTILSQTPLQSPALCTIANPITTGKCQTLAQNNLLALLPSPPFL